MAKAPHKSTRKRTQETAADDEPKIASPFTIAANEESCKGLDFKSTADADDATAHSLATTDSLVVKSSPVPGKEPRDVWSLVDYKDQKLPMKPGPDTVNPSLWRQAQLNQTNGLFQVTDRIYQVRAYDMSNMTIIELDDGLLLIDPLISVECAGAALDLYRTYGRKRKLRQADAPVRAIIFTHSHVDHFGGVLGVVREEDIETRDVAPEDYASINWHDGKVRVIAPSGFMEHAVSENVYAGIAMSRRAQYMYGPYLDKGDKGQVDGGLGKGQSTGSVSIARPCISIDRDCALHVDGVEIQFHMTPGAEAPSEFDFYFPQFRAFCASENACHTMHNIQTLRGARVRDSLQWSKYLNETLHRYGGLAQVLFASHHWPIWNTPNDSARVERFLTHQRDMYRYLNDQTLRMLNKGYTGVEIAEVFELPPAIHQDWSCRGYYGTVNHNVKAVYDRYMGWFDGNPSNLHALPPSESSTLYVDAMGGEGGVMTIARDACAAGNYRWAAEVLNKLVYAQPTNTNARHLLADVLEQLGYQAEAATWRNFYLMGAQELRTEPPAPEMTASDPSMTRQMTVEMIFDAIAATVNGPRAAAGPNMKLNWIFGTRSGDDLEVYLMELSNGALSTTPNRLAPKADVTIYLTREALNQLATKQKTLAELMGTGEIEIAEDELDKLGYLATLFEKGVVDFPIVTPRPDAGKAWRGEQLKIKDKGVLRAALSRKLEALVRIPHGC